MAEPFADRVVCPQCGELVPPGAIAYGYPSRAALERQRFGVSLGGCVVTDDSPRAFCPLCGVSLPGVRPASQDELDAFARERGIDPDPPPSGDVPF